MNFCPKTCRVVWLNFIIIFLVVAVFPQKGFSSPGSLPYVGQLKSIPSKPEKDIDLAEVLFLVSRDWNSEVNLNATLIDRMTHKVREKIADNSDPKSIVEILRHTIYTEEKFAFTDRVDPLGFPLDVNEWFFHGLLRSKRGYCMTLSLLYLIIGERLSLPLYGVALPNHFYVRYDSPGYRVNIETTQGGAELPDSFYYNRYNVTGQSPFFMKNLSKKQTLGAYFSNVGMAYFTKKLQDKAVFYLRLATEINPLSIEARNNLGNILSEMKLLDQAIDQYKAAWVTDPTHAATLLNLAIAYSEAKANEKAIEMFLQVVQGNPESMIAHQELARLYLEKKQPINALLHLKKLVRLDPQNLQHTLRMVDIYLQLSRPRLALQILLGAQASRPGNFHIKERLAETYYRLAKFDRAIEEFRYLIEQRPDFSRAYMQLGWTYYRMDNFKMAVVWTKRGLDKGKGEFATLGHMNLGLFYLMERNYREAKNWYGKALSGKNPMDLQSMIKDLNDAARKYPNFAELEFFSGWLHFEGGQGGRAPPHLKYYLSISPQGPHVEEARALLENIKSGPLKGVRPAPGKTLRPEDTPGGMVGIPAGDFIMGSDTMGKDERPAHNVYLDAYYIDKYEVSSEQFAEFLNAVPESRQYYRLNIFGVLGYDKTFFAKKENYPINNVSWVGADAFCRWKNKRLPTEAEWEKAARGTQGKVYPWGDEPPGPWKTRFNQFWLKLKLDVLVPVDSMPEGKSPFGLHHMAGNVKEWVEDWYDREYYKSQDHKINPPSPPGGTLKVLKGGSWNDLEGYIYSSFRNNSRTDMMLEDYGFRCAKSVGKSGN